VKLAALLAALLLAGSALAQQELPPNGVLLVAKPALRDANFSRTVILVTQTPDFSTVGVILNRPTTVRYQGKPVWTGGPVMRQVVVAVFRSDQTPKTTAFHILKGLYLSMQPEIVDALIADKNARYRLYSGFSGCMLKYRPLRMWKAVVLNWAATAGSCCPRARRRYSARTRADCGKNSWRARASRKPESTGPARGEAIALQLFRESPAQPRWRVPAAGSPVVRASAGG
jgi:hypothetical protein